ATGRHRLAAGCGDPGTRGASLRGEVGPVPWARRPRRGRGRDLRALGRRRRDYRHRGVAEDDCQFLALRDDGVRLYPAGDAVAAAADPDRRRGVCLDRLYFGAQQAHWGHRHDERRDAAQGAHAKSGRLYHALSRRPMSGGPFRGSRSCGWCPCNGYKPLFTAGYASKHRLMCVKKREWPRYRDTTRIAQFIAVCSSYIRAETLGYAVSLSSP